jgi:hypothetical protein
MSVQVTIDAASKADAQLIAADLPGRPQAGARRGFGVIQLRFRRESDAKELVSLVSDCVKRHRLDWARVRIGDDQYMFRGQSARAS